MAILTEKPKAWESYQRVYPPGFSPIATKDAVSHPEILQAARVFIDKNVRANKPIGWREAEVVNGRNVCFTIEPHYNVPNGPNKPWGWHKGCSVAVETPNETLVQGEDGPSVHGEESDMGMDAAKVKKTAVVAVPALGGLFLLGPLGGVIGLVGGLAWNHFKK